MEIQVGQTISYHDMANPYREGVIVRISEKQQGNCFLLFGGKTTMETITHDVEVIYPESWHKSTIAANMINNNGHAGHQMTSKPILSAQEVNHIIAEYERMQPILRAKAEQSDREKRIAQEHEKDRIRREHPDLTVYGNDEHSQYAIGAKNLRKELNKAFPETKFSVTSEGYSMGCSIDVRWAGGPSSEEVSKIADKYQYGHFDGMEDLYHYHEEVWTDVFGGAKYVCCQRKLEGEN